MNFFRGHRTRHSESIRNLVRETQISARDFVYPLFITEEAHSSAITAMPGQGRHTLDDLPKIAQEIVNLKIPAVILFGIPLHKDEHATSAFADDGIVQKATGLLKTKFPSLCVITDVCLCEYTSHGHCGLLKENGELKNDASIERLAQVALSHAKAGADIVAPSDMMDGRVSAIRKTLDEAGFVNTPIMSYAAKYASAFYGPFRDAAGSTPQFGDRRGYQMDPANKQEALREIAADVSESADFIIVKPALCYLDVISQAKQNTSLPIVAYNVSGEYSMVKAASGAGYLDEKRTTMEILTSIKRAGADIIITYHAMEVARWLASENTL